VRRDQRRARRLGRAAIAGDAVAADQPAQGELGRRRRLEDRIYRMRELLVRDLNGYVLAFGAG